MTSTTRLIGLLLGIVGLGVESWLESHSAQAVELWSDSMGSRRYSLDAALKWTSVLSHALEDTILYPERWSASNLFRFRLTFQARPAPWLDSEFAYEQRARTVSESSGAGGGLGILFPEARAPYRIWELDEPLVEVGSTFSYRHELDRALVALQRGRAELRIGRQAVGWGRGVFFGAVDIFAPFTPLEIDREWRRGIDAIRGLAPLTDLTSLEVVAAFDETWDDSALVGRLQGYAGRVDGELAFGKRARDAMAAATASLPLLAAEIHGELAFFETPEDFPEGGVFGRDDLVAKAVLGGSYSWNPGRELYALAEYHYSGFGIGDVQDLPERLQDPDYQERFLRGDTQTLGRHVIAMQVNYGGATTKPVGLAWILSATDGSGVVIPSVTWVFSDNVTFVVTGYLPHGAEPVNGILQSEYGGNPASGILQANFYY